MKDFDQKFENLASVFVEVGLNVQSGQRLLIWANPEIADLVRVITAKAYQRGARLVSVMWKDQYLDRIQLQHGSPDTLTEYPVWAIDTVVDYMKNGDAVLQFANVVPDLYAGLDAKQVAVLQRTAVENNQRIGALRAQNATNFVIAPPPMQVWAARVFPDAPADRQLPLLWDAIFTICRANLPDPIAAWEEHASQLARRSDYLNKKQYASLKMTGPGTDLTVGLPQNHVWRSARMRTQNGIDAIINIPTEEVFTLPHKDRVDGVVSATRPLVYRGSFIDGIQLTFQDGQVVEYSAKVGEKHLQTILEMDDGSRRLGEVALVPHSSPISQSGLTFYSILVDENASNHLALGLARKFGLAGYETMSEEDLATAGCNQSMVHVDFMIGSGEMDVDGITAEGKTEPIFRRGEWAIET